MLRFQGHGCEHIGFMLPILDENFGRPGSFMLQFQGHICAELDLYVAIPRSELRTTWQFYVAISRRQLRTA
jgi:hypothetical protein